MHFHGNVPLLRSYVTVATASTTAMTFWVGRAAATPLQHPNNNLTRVGDGIRSAARGELERGRGAQ
jgi:hypothetical protein